MDVRADVLGGVCFWNTDLAIRMGDDTRGGCCRYNLASLLKSPAMCVCVCGRASHLLPAPFQLAREVADFG